MGTPQLTEHLRQGLIDFVLTTGTIEQNDIVSSLLMRASAVCVMPREHPLASVETVGLEGLHKHKLILLNDTDDIVIAMRAQLRNHEYPDDIAIETNSSITICSLVAAGAGVGIVNPFVAKSFADRLVVKPLRPSIGMEVTLARSVTLAPSVLANRFIELLEASLRELRAEQCCHAPFMAAACVATGGWRPSMRLVLRRVPKGEAACAVR